MFTIRMMKFKIMIIRRKNSGGTGIKFDPSILYGFVSNTGIFYSFGELERKSLPYPLIPVIIEDLSRFFMADVAYDTFDDDEYCGIHLSEDDEILYEEEIYTP